MSELSRNLFALVLCSIWVVGSAQSSSPQPGDELFAQGRFEEAATAYELALAKAPDSATTLARLARMRLYEGRDDEAISLAKRVLTAAVGDPIATTTLNVATARHRNFSPDVYQVEAHTGTYSVPFVITDPLPVVRLTIGGRSADFLIDTGAPDIVLERSFAEKLGLSLKDGAVGTFAGGQQAPVSRTVVPLLEIGGVRIRNVPAAVTASLGLQLPGSTIEGVVGTGLLMHFLSTIDYCSGALVLAPRSASAEFQNRSATAGGNAVPFWLVGDHFVFARGKLNQTGGLFMIDTGLAGGGLVATKAALEAAGVKLDENTAMTGQGGGGAVTFTPFRAAATLGNLTRSDVPGIYIPGRSALAAFPFESAGMISHAFFRNSRLTLDFDAMKMTTENCKSNSAH